MTEEKKKGNKQNHTPGKAFKGIVQTTLISSWACGFLFLQFFQRWQLLE